MRAARTRRWLSAARDAVFLPGRLGDIGIALLALWLTAQINPGIALFAVNFEPGLKPAGAGPVAPDTAATMVEAAQSAFQMVGVGLFLALLLRDRRYVGGAVLLLIGAAHAAEGIGRVAAAEARRWEAWLKPGVAGGIAAGCARAPARRVHAAAGAGGGVRHRAAVVAAAAARWPPTWRRCPAPLTLFNWRYGHLLNYNGLTHTVLLVWPIAAAAWLFALAGRPAWGRPD